MDSIQKSVVTLMRSAVTGQSLPLPEDFALEQIREYVRMHSIQPLAYEGARLCAVESPLMERLQNTYCKMLLISEGQMAKIQQIFDAFENAGVDYMPLKGSRMKHLYPKAELRMMSDADILIRLEQYDTIVPIMESLGFEAVEETDHELVWKHPRLEVELHKRLIPSYNKDYYAYFGDGWQLAKEHDGHYFRMKAEDEWIYQLTHFAKHFRDGGIGCRHVLDLWMYLRANPEMDEAYIEQELAKLEMLDFHRNVCRLTRYWFEDGPEDEVVELMSQYVMASGSWGNMEARVRSLTLRDQKHSALGFSAKLVYIRNKLFPRQVSCRKSIRFCRKLPGYCR